MTYWYNEKKAPILLNFLLIGIVCTTFLTSFLDQNNYRIFDFSFFQLFSLSPLMYINYFFWQPCTALFLLPTQGFTFGAVIDVLFALLLLRTFAIEIIDQLGSKRFLIFYTLSSVCAGLSAIGTMSLLTQFCYQSLCITSIIACMTLWTHLKPYQEVNLFFLFTIKAKTFFLLAVVILFVFYGLEANWSALAACGTAILYGYFYCLLVLDQNGIFKRLFTIEQTIKRGYLFLKQFYEWRIVSPIRKKKWAKR